LHYSARRGDVAIARLLIERGADVNARNVFDNDPHEQGDGRGELGQTALHLAARHGHIELARLLLDSGANVNEIDYYKGSTPLHYAASYQRFHLVQLLIDRGAKVNARNRNGLTPLRLAEDSDPSVRELLIANGGDPSIGSYYRPQ
jgi:ankyrin repeat protein